MVEQARASDLLERFGAQIVRVDACRPSVDAFALGWPELDGVLPDGGLPRGVVELRGPKALGSGTSIALGAIRAAQARDERAWCAWIDPDGTLYSPGVAMSAVDLHRLVVVRPSRESLRRTAVKVARSQAFQVIVVDLDPCLGPEVAVAERTPRRRTSPRAVALEVWVRKLGMLATEGGATILVLTDASIARPSPLPVALRLELARTETAIGVRVGKDRHARIGGAKAILIASRPGLQLAV